MKETFEDKKKHSQAALNLALLSGIILPIFITSISIWLPTFRAQYFYPFFFVYSVSLPLGFLIFLYSVIINPKKSWYLWILVIAWFLIAMFFFLATFNRV
jgi:hypothetical protein